jgi:hypothetical protein
LAISARESSPTATSAWWSPSASRDNDHQERPQKGSGGDAKPKHFGYTFNNMPLSPGYVPAPAGINFNCAAGVNSIANSPGCRW